MELEQRVQVLEQEVQILKSQIQAALLEIQELLLSQTHTDLHDSEQPLTSLEADTLPAAPVKRVSISPNGEYVVQASPVPAAPSPALSPVVPTAPAPADTEPDWTQMARLEKWASEKVQKIGAKKTRYTIKLYAEQGRFSRTVRDQLLRFVAIFEDEDAHHAKPTAPKQRPEPKTPASAHQDDDSAQKLVLRLIAGVQNVGIQSVRRKNG